MSERSSGAAMGLLCLCLCAMTGSTLAATRFAFHNAEFMPEAQGLEAAQDFVKAQLPQGLAMNLAVARLRQADATCRRQARQSVIVCTYSAAAHPAMGDTGEDVWTVRLIPAANGALQSASVARAHVGL